jgi:hypothetical protein
MPARLFLQLEDRFIGEKGDVGKSGDRRDRRTAAGRDDRPPERQLGPERRRCLRFIGGLRLHRIDADRGAAGETRLAEEDVDTERREARCRVVRRDVGTPRAHAGHHRCEMDVRLGSDADAATGASLSHHASRTKQRLRGDAAGIEAVAAEACALDQRNPRAESRGARGADQAGCAAADDDEVVEMFWGRIGPVGRANVGTQAIVVEHLSILARNTAASRCRA